MQWVLILLVASVVLAGLQVALTVLLVLLALSLVWGVFFRTAETIGLLTFCLVWSLLTKHPIAMLTLIGFLALLASIRALPASGKPEPRLLPLLADAEENEP